MKCPKCLYIGFETGDRCKNCGYDFSLLAIAEEAEAPAADLPLREPARATVSDVSSAVGEAWSSAAMDRFRDLPDAEPAEAAALPMNLADPASANEVVIEPVVVPPVVVPAVAAVPAPVPRLADTDAGLDSPELPLFEPDAADDEPLVKLPAVPRVPLSVRRTPDAPRLRHPPAIDPRQPTLPEEPGLQFGEPRDEDEPAADERFVSAPSVESRPTFPRADPAREASPLGRRIAAAAIDYSILLSIDFVVLYLTLRLTELTPADWQALPMLPMAAFLLALKVAYFSAFTTAGGQTIGKMATHIRVVSEDGGGLDPGRALRRAVLGLASIATAGAPFLTALSDPARRGVHDRASGTRVVALPSS